MIVNNEQTHIIKTARTTGIWYLMMAITGILGFMVFHSQIFVSGNPEQTLSNLVALESTARIRLLLEFAIVLSQALTAVWFFKLFKDNYEWGAWTLGIWGMVNAVAIMISAISIASAIGIANSDISITEDKVLLIQMLQHMISNAWGIGGLFFGLWLFPMGYIVIKSKRLPIWLGRVLILGGIGYLVSTIIRHAGIDFSYNRFLTIPATIGEFWMIGYLLIFGIRPINEKN
ncbi:MULTISPECIES: DUF4386 domain-containing protein [Maribacter]|uniref:DUF4386 domain-containing protein n=1 Tax=Maribacter flavus TaxID=1658664 RepID=A0ABU7IGY5_9FLAO|nr:MULTISPECIES: DUF4386 domain-containing protein [Maribacter]MDC6405310.1 DUF4386 domain-containing protein [Maribacter sp. PR66]MEE1971881.1 DUF4386 domain-containing protein [Maribacter flavus]